MDGDAVTKSLGVLCNPFIFLLWINKARYFVYTEDIKAIKALSLSINTLKPCQKIYNMKNVELLCKLKIIGIEVNKLSIFCRIMQQGHCITIIVRSQ